MGKPEHVEGYGKRMWAIKDIHGDLCWIRGYRDDCQERLSLFRSLYGESASVVQVVVVEKD